MNVGAEQSMSTLACTWGDRARVGLVPAASSSTPRRLSLRGTRVAVVACTRAGPGCLYLPMTTVLSAVNTASACLPRRPRLTTYACAVREVTGAEQKKEGEVQSLRGSFAHCKQDEKKREEVSGWVITHTPVLLPRRTRWRWSAVCVKSVAGSPDPAKGCTPQLRPDKEHIHRTVSSRPDICYHCAPMVRWWADGAEVEGAAGPHQKLRFGISHRCKAHTN